MTEEYDKLKLYFGYDYIVNDSIVIRQPTIGSIVDYGEQSYFGMVYTLCGIPSNRKSELWDMGIDYEEISDYEYFRLVCRAFTSKETGIILGDLDFSKFEERLNTQNDNIVLYNPTTDVIIDEFIYYRIISYLRMLHGIVPKVERAADSQTKKLLIKLDRDDKKKAQKENKSILLPLISGMLNSSGFKYTKSQLKDVGLYEFMDSVKRIQKIKEVESLTAGYYSNVDFSKFNTKKLNWLTDAD